MLTYLYIVNIIKMSEYVSASEAAKLLGISRIAVFKKIQNGQIKAEKVGRNYIIKLDDLGQIFKEKISNEKKQTIDKAIKKTIKEYGEALKKLKET